MIAPSTRARQVPQSPCSRSSAAAKARSSPQWIFAYGVKAPDVSGPRSAVWATGRVNWASRNDRPDARSAAIATIGVMPDEHVPFRVLVQ